MTCRTYCEFLTVDKSMTCLALRHDLIPVLFHRIVRLKFCMTFCTVDLMLAAFSFDLIEDGCMATATISRGKGRQFNLIGRQRFRRRFRSRGASGSCCRRRRSFLCRPGRRLRGYRGNCSVAQATIMSNNKDNPISKTISFSCDSLLLSLLS